MQAFTAVQDSDHAILEYRGQRLSVYSSPYSCETPDVNWTFWLNNEFLGYGYKRTIQGAVAEAKEIADSHRIFHQSNWVKYKDLTNGLRVELSVYRGAYNLFVIGRNTEIIDRCCGIRNRDDADGAFDAWVQHYQTYTK